MYRQEQIAEIAENQTLEFLNKDTGIPREFLSSIPQIENFATIITGIRRCGKSTLYFNYLQMKPIPYCISIGKTFELQALNG